MSSATCAKHQGTDCHPPNLALCIRRCTDARTFLNTWCFIGVWSLLKAVPTCLLSAALQLSREVIQDMSFDAMHALVQSKGFVRVAPVPEHDAGR